MTSVLGPLVHPDKAMHKPYVNDECFGPLVHPDKAMHKPYAFDECLAPLVHPDKAMHKPYAFDECFGRERLLQKTLSHPSIDKLLLWQRSSS
jgi:hypothetical protein